MLSKKKTILVIVFLFALFSVFIFFNKTEDMGNVQEKQCYSVEERIVNGTSLDPMIKDGDTINVFLGYYDCHQIEREDIVVYQYSKSKDPVIKIVKGIPNDKFEVKQTELGYNIVINDQAAVNSESDPYLLKEANIRMLSLYQKNYKGVIPEDAYLILGNLTSGSFDSTQFGLISENDIIGKVEW